MCQCMGHHKNLCVSDKGSSRPLHGVNALFDAFNNVVTLGFRI